MRRMSPVEAFPYLMHMSNGRMNPERGRVLINVVKQLVSEVPVFEFCNHADEGVELITYSAMRDAAKQGENAI